MSVYEFFPLPDQQRYVRLLTLDPGESDAPLIGKLNCVDVNDDLEEYDPVSYVWGDPTRTHEILLGDKRQPLGLTTNLYNALKRFRQPDTEKRLWVDQICINQDDPDERSQQVQFMNVIYKNAGHVLVWLGQDDQQVAGSAFELVCQIGETFRSDERLAKFREDHTDDLDQRSEDDWTPIKRITQLQWVSQPTQAI